MSRLGKIKAAATSFLDQYKTESPATFAAASQAVGGLLILDGFVGIENPLGGNKRPGIFGSLIGIVVGLVMTLGFGLFAGLFGLNNMTAVTTATVTNVIQPNTSYNTNSNSQPTCTAQASYSVNGKEYLQTGLIGSSSICSLIAGQTIQINYDPNNPGSWGYEVETTKTILKIFPLVGIVILISSIITFIIRLLCIIFGWKLLKNGRTLAKALPPETNLSTIKNEVRQNFAKYLFGFGTGSGQIITPQTQPPTSNPI